MGISDALKSKAVLDELKGYLSTPGLTIRQQEMLLFDLENICTNMDTAWTCIQELTQKVHSLTPEGRIQDLEEALQIKQNTIDQQDKVVQNLSAMVNSLQNSLSAAEQNAREAESAPQLSGYELQELEDLRQKVSTLEDELNRTQEERDEAQSYANNSEEEKEDLEREVDRLNDELEELKEELHSRLDVINALKDEALREREYRITVVSEYKERLDSLRDMITTSESMLSVVNTRIQGALTIMEYPYPGDKQAVLAKESVNE